jgi:hypothetical protein
VSPLSVFGRVEPLAEAFVVHWDIATFCCRRGAAGGPVGPIPNGSYSVQSQVIVTPTTTLVVSSVDMTRHDPLDFLLDLDGEVIVQDSGYWVKIEARRRDPSPQVPHGIDYSLTLHDKYGKRVLGFDNAHAAPKKSGRFSPRRVEYDHWHPDGRTTEV